MSRLEDLLDGFRAEIEVAIDNLANKGKGGQHVPFHGDFANVPPSRLIKLEWWERAFREATPAPAILSAARMARGALGRCVVPLEVLAGEVRRGDCPELSPSLRARILAAVDGLPETLEALDAALGEAQSESANLSPPPERP